MKKTLTIIFACFCLIVSACKNANENKSTIDAATLTKQVTESESKLFTLLKAGKVNDAFACIVMIALTGILLMALVELTHKWIPFLKVMH
jgi:hypothetical protein